ncbi:MAG: glycoside hydrolase family 3 protein [Oscillospiraceae bacterium]|nr:glycoside hydrolase family 3 protein [Oscillospiraceae bacterium]
MKKRYQITSLLLCAAMLLSGCGRQSEEVAEDVETTSVVTTTEEETEAATEAETEKATTKAKKDKKDKEKATTLAVTTTVVSSGTTIVSGTTKAGEKASTQKNGGNSSNGGTSNGGRTNKRSTAAATTKAGAVTTKTTTTTTKAVQTEPTAPALPTDAPTEAPTDAPIDTHDAELMRKICQMFVITPEALAGFSPVTAAKEGTRSALSNYPVGGLIYFAANLNSVSQAQAMLANSMAYAKETNDGIGLFLCVDEEGGLVARCANKLGTTKLSPMATYGARNDWNEAFSVGQTLGNDIRYIGFNVDFAPVADVDLDPGNELGTRIFSSDPNVVANMVSGVVQGIQSTGAAATLKHFPGLGAENGNAHNDVAVYIDRSLDQLRAEEFVPFRAGIDAGSDFVMVSHQIVSGVGDGLPACLSDTVCTDLLRGELGFQGLIVTDSLQMNTISGTYSSGEAAVRAIEAGVDVILMPMDFPAAVEGVKNAVATGRISEARINESYDRIIAEKSKLGLIG